MLEKIIYKISTLGNDDDQMNNIDNEKINTKGDDVYNYIDDFIIFEYLIIFLLSKFDKEVYYKHQYISYIFIILVEVIKNVYFLIKVKYYNITFIIIIFLNFIYSILIAIYIIYKIFNEI